MAELVALGLIGYGLLSIDVNLAAAGVILMCMAGAGRAIKA